MNQAVNEREMMEFIAGRTKADHKAVALVLKHEQTFLNNARANAKGEVDIDSDDLVDYVLSRRDFKLDELTVERILEAEMDYLMDKGLAGYLD